jgi:flagellum-specific peptidoglycan hydrolase FlgJ
MSIFNSSKSKLVVGSLLMLTFQMSTLAQKMKAPEYISVFQKYAVDEMKRTGVPAAISLAQGLLETEIGNGVLYKKSKNHFGIKCKNDWTGEVIDHDDDAPGECFRV